MSGPFGRGVSGDGKMQDTPSVMSEHEKHVQNLKPDRRHGEEVDRNQTLEMIFQEGPPGLGWWFPTVSYVFAHARFADLDAQLQ